MTQNLPLAHMQSAYEENDTNVRNIGTCTCICKSKTLT